jgi:ribonuclease P protein component
LKEFSLSRREKIKSRSELDLLFTKGKILYSKKNRFKTVLYLLQDSNETGVKVVFAVHKKAGNAVWRNRVKRLMRESYRLNKKILSEHIGNRLLLLAFSPSRISQRNFRKIKLQDVTPEIIDLLNQVKLKISE